MPITKNKKKRNEKKRLKGFLLRDQDLPLQDRRQGWKHEGQGAPRGRGTSCCVSHFQLILSGRSTYSTLSGVPSPWRHDPDKFSDRLPRNAGRSKACCYSTLGLSQLYGVDRLFKLMNFSKPPNVRITLRDDKKFFVTRIRSRFIRRNYFFDKSQNALYIFRLFLNYFIVF